VIRVSVVLTFLLAVSFHGGTGFLFSQDAPKEKAAFSFADVGYFHRFSQAGLHEYTPAGQEDLSNWTDMLTVQHFAEVKDGEQLANAANVVLENYRREKALVLRTDSIPRTKEKEAEHLIVVLFVRPTFIEAAFAKLKIDNGAGVGLIYSHRIYGNRIGDQMSEWIERKGEDIERALLKFEAPPKPENEK
jgi:hypothetical protein